MNPDITAYSENEIHNIADEAMNAGFKAADNYFKENLGGEDNFPCGFAWVYIDDVKGNTKVGRNLKKAGIRQDYSRKFQIWNPSKYVCQNVDTLYAGAAAAAKVWQKYGFNAYAGQRWD